MFTVDKIHELKARLDLMEEKPSIISISEVKPKNFKFERQLSEYIIDGYELVPINLGIRDGGRGLLIYVKDNLTFNHINLGVDFLEYACVEIVLNKQEKLLYTSIYRSPSSDINNNNKLNTLLKEIVSRKYSHTIINGDINYPGIDWENISTSQGPGEDEYEFIETIRDCFLYQHILENTRGRGSDNPSLIDLVFSNEEGMVSDVNVDAPLGKSDHAFISYCLNVHRNGPKGVKTVYRYDRADWDRMSDLMNIDWKEKLRGLDTNGQWVTFRDMLLGVVEQCVPKKTVSRDGKRRRDVENRKLRTKVKRKQRLWNRYIKGGDMKAYEEYKRCRNQIRTLTRKLVKNREKNIAEKSKTNPKSFWNYVQKKTKVKTSVSDLYKDTNNSSLTCNDAEKANVLADFFTSVFTVDKDDKQPNITIADVPELNTINITPNVVENRLKNLNISKSPGPDGLHPRILHDLRSAISTPLSIIFNSSWAEGVIPDEWKCANVTALFKKGDRQMAGNYRPVSLTCILCKVMEGIVRENMVKHMKLYKLFSNKQYGFISGRSTVLQLLTVIDRWTEILDEGGAVDVAYCDFMKAFDKVSHEKLLHKLNIYNFGDKYRSWIGSFLHDRKQRVIVNGEKSDWKNVTSGIPQGSVLGPICFVLYINDLPTSFSNNSEVFLFADDTKIFRQIMCKDDCELLQTDIYDMKKWSDTWMLKFHPDKCKVMRIGRSKVDQYDYKMDSSYKPMSKSTEEKDIGVVIDNKLTFQKHINEKVNKANSIVGIIRRTFEYLDNKMFCTLFKALVRPHIEYANPVWSPHLKKNIEMIENVQRRATKQVPGLSDLSYEERLKELNLPSLVYRRLRGDLIEVYKILSGKYDPEVSDLFNLNTQQSTRGHNFKLYKKRPRLNVRKYSFCYRVVDAWNRLPNDIVTAKSVHSFERKLDKFLKDEPVKYKYDEPLSFIGVNENYSEEDEELVPEGGDALLPEEVM